MLHGGQPFLAMFIPVSGGQGISRPFVVGLILLLVFLGMQSDFVPTRPPDSSTTEETAVPAKDSAKERVKFCCMSDHLELCCKALLKYICKMSVHLQIILELSKSNEKLEVACLLTLLLLVAVLAMVCCDAYVIAWSYA